MVSRSKKETTGAKFVLFINEDTIQIKSYKDLESAHSPSHGGDK